MNENEVPENLKQAMEEYARQYELMDADAGIKELEEIRDELLRQVNDVDLRIEKVSDVYMRAAKELEKYIEGQVKELERSVKHAGVEAKHTSGYVRSTWQSKIIEKILFDNPALIPLFKPAKKETEVKSRVNVTYIGPPEEIESVAFSREDYEATQAEVENGKDVPF